MEILNAVATLGEAAGAGVCRVGAGVGLCMVCTGTGTVGWYSSGGGDSSPKYIRAVHMLQLSSSGISPR
eukprot:9844109-Ditylum_brightwellii.AAC.2